MISYIAHEFRTPLSTILLFLKALKDDITNQSKVHYKNCDDARGRNHIYNDNSLIKIGEYTNNTASDMSLHTHLLPHNYNVKPAIELCDKDQDPYQCINASIESITSSVDSILEKINIIINNIKEVKKTHTQGHIKDCITNALTLIQSNFPNVEINILNNESNFIVQESELVITMMKNLMYHSCVVIDFMKEKNSDTLLEYENQLNSIKDFNWDDKIKSKNEFSENHIKEQIEKYIYYKKLITEIKKKKYYIEINLQENKYSNMLSIKDNVNSFNCMHIPYVFSEIFINMDFRIAIRLIYCKKIMEIIGGIAACESKDNEYCTVYVFFPKI